MVLWASDRDNQPYSRAYWYGEPMVNVREARDKCYPCCLLKGRLISLEATVWRVTLV